SRRLPSSWVCSSRATYAGFAGNKWIVRSRGMVRSMTSSLRDNPAYLKLDLYCRGLRLDESCYVEADGGRKILRTRAGLGSGLELVLPGGLWTNVPVTESF